MFTNPQEHLPNKNIKCLYPYFPPLKEIKLVLDLPAKGNKISL